MNIFAGQMRDNLEKSETSELLLATPKKLPCAIPLFPKEGLGEIL
jgi:hypothetical protein